MKKNLAFIRVSDSTLWWDTFPCNATQMHLTSTDPYNWLHYKSLALMQLLQHIAWFASDSLGHQTDGLLFSWATKQWKSSFELKMNVQTYSKQLVQISAEDRTHVAGLGAILLLHNSSPMKTWFLCASLTAQKFAMQKWKSPLIIWIKKKLRDLDILETMFL